MRILTILILVSISMVGFTDESALFQPQSIDPAFPGAYQVKIADINHDGQLDIAALGEGKTALVQWYENPSWTKHPLAPPEIERPIDLDFADIDGDGLVEAAVAAGFNLGDSRSGGEIYWLQRTDSLDLPWQAHLLYSEPTAHRLRWADPNQDGILDLIVLPIIGVGAQGPSYDQSPVRLLQFTNISKFSHLWKMQTIDHTLHLAHGIFIDHNGNDRILTASLEGITAFRNENGTWQKERLCAGQPPKDGRPGCSEIAIGKLENKQSYLATIEPWHGDKVAVYFMGKEKPLPREVIDDSFDQGHAIACADFDQDGDDEIIAGYRGKGHSIYYYDYQKSKQAHWVRTLISNDLAAQGFAIADVNNDGCLDFVSTGGSTHNVTLFINKISKN